MRLILDAATEVADASNAAGETASDKRKDHAMRQLFPTLATVLLASIAQADVTVASTAELETAAHSARPGDTIRLRPGTYRPGLRIVGLAGTADQPITLLGEGGVLFDGGNVGLQLSECSHVTLRNLAFHGQKDNGLNIDDGGKLTTPCRGIVLDGITVTDVGPIGICNGLKLSGLDDFNVQNCRVAGWGGSAIDLVGCHDGVIERSQFAGKPGFSQNSGVQIKGGSANITVRECAFASAGARAINAGGSTGLDFFRPPLVQGQSHAEARNLTVAHNRFEGSETPIAFVGLDGGSFHHNTIRNPTRWLFRVLQENTAEGFAPCRGVTMADNTFEWSEINASNVINLGQAIAFDTFVFTGNAFYRSDKPAASQALLPTASLSSESRNTFGIRPNAAATPPTTRK